MGRDGRVKRRTFILAPLAAFAVGGVAWRVRRQIHAEASDLVPHQEPRVTGTVGNMRYRRFGRTELDVSEVGFGAWAIGGRAYGAANHQESLRALARAEELGCNFVDTALVYGDSELVLGEFLKGRRDRWIVATKYSGQPSGMTATLELQLRRLGTDHVDFYQIHWAPGAHQQQLYDELARLKRDGKARFVGVSLYTPREIDYVVDHAQLDGVQLPFSLLDPMPFLPRMQRLRDSGLGVIIRSSLKEGFLTGKYRRDAVFADPSDQRSTWSRERIARTVDQVNKLRFLESDAGSLLLAAARYPLCYPEVSTVILGTKSVEQADSNFGQVSGGGRLSRSSLERVARLQLALGLWGGKALWSWRLRRILGIG